MTMLQCTCDKLCLHRLLLRLFHLSEEEHQECSCKDCKCNVHCRSSIYDSSFLCNLTDESTKNDINSHCSCAIECATNLDKLVSAVTATTKHIEERINYGVEHTHAESADECTCKINPHAFHRSRKQLKHHSYNSHDECKQSCLLIAELHDKHTRWDSHHKISHKVGIVTDL